MKALNPQLSQVPDVRSLIFKSGWRERGEKNHSKVKSMIIISFHLFDTPMKPFFLWGQEEVGNQ